MRVLPVHEWPKLSNVPCDTPWWLFDPIQTRVLVVEHGESIVGTVSLLPFVHAECLWIAPEHRKRGHAARRLLRAVYQHAIAMKASRIWSGSVSEQMTSILYRLGAVKIPGFSYVFPVRRDVCRQS